jgi:hypothetical protein
MDITELPPAYMESSKQSILLTACYLGLLFDPEDGSSIFLQNTGERLLNYMEVQPEIILFIVIAMKTLTPKCFSTVLFHFCYECSKLKIQLLWKNGCPASKMPVWGMAVNVLTTAN